jgi:hypothetical protein
MGSWYDKREKQVMYVFQWLDYPDRENWIEEPFEHIMTALKMLREFHKSNTGCTTRPSAQELRAYIPVFLGLSMLKLFDWYTSP